MLKFYFIATDVQENNYFLCYFVVVYFADFRLVSLCFVILRLINKRNTITFKRSVCLNANTAAQYSIQSVRMKERKQQRVKITNTFTKFNMASTLL